MRKFIIIVGLLLPTIIFAQSTSLWYPKEYSGTTYLRPLNNSWGVSGSTLYVTGTTTLGSTVTINGVTYTFPASDGSSTYVLTTDGAGALSWTATLAGTGVTVGSGDARYVNVGGDTMTGALTIDNEGGEPSLVVIGTMSGDSLTVMSGANSYILGKVGIGTDTPQRDLHVSSPNGMLLLEDTDGELNRKNWYMRGSGYLLDIGYLDDDYSRTGSSSLISIRADEGSGGGFEQGGDITIGLNAAPNTRGGGNSQVGVYIGKHAGRNMAADSYGGNVAIGANALESCSDNTTKQCGENVAIGYAALHGAESAFGNVAVGFNVLAPGSANAVHQRNVCIGTDACFASGNDEPILESNVGIGVAALSYISQNSQKNVMVGGNLGGNYYDSINDTVGLGHGIANAQNNSNLQKSVYVGFQSGFNVENGSGHTFIGYKSGDNATSANKSIVLGYDLDLPSTTTANQMTIGNLIFGTGVDGTGTGVSTGNIGIGLNNPSTKLEVQGTISGSDLFATTALSGAGLTDCDNATTSKLLWSDTGVFSCGTDQGGTGITETSGDARYVLVAGDTMTGDLILQGKNLIASGGIITENLTVSGALSLESTISLNSVVYTFPYSDGASSGKVLATDSAGQLSWVTDTDTDTNTQLSTGALITVFDNRYVETAGDTMTGVLKVRANLSGSSLIIDGEALVYGALNVSGATLLGSTVSLGGVEYTFPASDGAASGKVLATDALGTLTWATDSDTQHSDGANCDPGEIPLGVDEYGVVEGCYEPTESDITDLVHLATAITDGLIIEPDLNADSTPDDGDILTYDTTGTNFEWITPDAGTDITADLEEETHASEHASGGGDAVDHDALTNFVGNEHIDWTDTSEDLKTTGMMTGAYMSLTGYGNCTLKTDAAGNISCGTDQTGAAGSTISGSIIFEEGDVVVAQTGAIADFDGNDFNLTENPEFEVNIVINDAGIDHGGISGLTDDDHIQYINVTRGDSRYVNTAGDTMTGALIIQGNLTASSAILTSALSVSGAVSLDSTISLNSVVYTFPYSDGVASGRVLATDSAGQLTWKTDANTGGGSSDTGALMSVFDNRYVETGGDTMTGALKVRASLSGSSLTVDNLQNCNTIDTNGQGVFVCGTDSGGGVGESASGFHINMQSLESTTANASLYDMFDNTSYPDSSFDYSIGSSNGFGFTPSNGRFTALNEGTYVIRANLIITDSSIAVPRLVISVNGASVWDHSIMKIHSSVDPVERTISTIQELSANDYVEFSVDSQGVDTIIINTGSTVDIFQISRGGGGTSSSTGITVFHGDARYVNVSGDTMTGSLDVSATASGWVIHAQDLLTSSGALSVDGLSYLTGNVTSAGTIEGATITEGGNAVYNATETPGGELGGTWASPTIDDGISIASITLTTAVTATGLIGDEDLQTEDFGEFSCAGEDACTIDSGVIDADNIGADAVQVSELDISSVSDDIAADIAEGELADSIVVSADIKDGTIVVADLASADFGDWTCNGTTCTLDTAYTTQATDDSRYVNISGDTMTGALIIQGNLTASSAILTSNLSVSGAVSFDSTVSLNSTVYTFPYSDGASSGKILATDSSGQLSWVTDTNTTYSAGEGIDLTGTVFSRIATITGSSLEIFGEMSGATLVVSGLNCSGNENGGALSITSNGQVVCTDDDSASGFSTGNVLTIFGSDDRWVDTAGDTMTGALVLESTLSLNGVVYTFPPSDGVSSGWVLKTDSSGTLSWAADTDTDTTYSAAQGLTLASEFFSLNTAITGATLQVATSLASSGTLSVDGVASLQGVVTITEGALTDSMIVGADIKDDTIDSADYAANSIDPEHLVDNFTWDTFPSTPSSAPDADYEVANKKYVDDNESDTTYSAGEGLDLTGTVFSRIATITGTTLHVTTSLASSGVLSVETMTYSDVTGELTGNASTATALAANGANCSAGQYPLGVDASGASEDCTADVDTQSSTGALQTVFDNRYVNTSGDTMTGDLVIQGASLTATGVYATGSMSASGALSVEGLARFQNATDSTTGFQILDANGGTPILNVDTTSERIGIGNSAPAYILDVTGDAHVSTYLTVDGVSAFGGTAASQQQLLIERTTADVNSRYGVHLDFTTQATETGSYHTRGMSFNTVPEVDAGITNTGSLSAVRGEALGAAGMSGTLTNLFGFNFVVGANDGMTGTIDTVNAIKVTPYYKAGTIGTFRNLYFDTPVTGGTATNKYDMVSDTGWDWLFDGDNQKLVLGEGQDSSIFYDGTNLSIHPKDVGSGVMDVSGTISGTTLLISDLNCTDAQVIGGDGSGGMECQADAGGTGITETSGDARYVNVAGDTMTGSLIISGGLIVNENSDGNYDFRVESDTKENMLFVDSSVNRVLIGSASNTTSNFWIAVGGGGAVFNDVGDNQDFRIEGNADTNLFFLDAGLDRIGISDATPNATLDVSGTISGASIHAQDDLTSSGTLSIEGVTSIQGTLAITGVISATTLTTDGGIVYSDGTSLQNTAVGSSGQVLVSQGTDAPKFTNLTGTGMLVWYLDDDIQVATDYVATYYAPVDMILKDVKMDADIAPTGADFVIDINEAGSTVLSTKPQMDIGTTTETGSHVFSDTFIDKGDTVTLDVDQIGSTVSGCGVTVMLYFQYTLGQ